MRHLPGLLITATIYAATTAAISVAAPTETAGRPNIVFILVDDLGWSDLGCYGHRYHRTPNIDRLAGEGMRFTNGYSPAPICSAARASMLTGKAVPRLGFEFVTKNQPGRQKIDTDVPLASPPFTLNLPLEEQSIAERLDELDYRTAFFGKWHVSQHYQGRYLAWHADFGPKQQGFAIAKEDFGDHPYAWRNKRPADSRDGVIPDDTMFGNAIDFIASEHDRPYFAMVSTFYVHTPVKNRCRWLVRDYENKIPADARNRSKRLEYAAFVETLDHHIGKVLDAIDDSGQRDKTLVVFVSDNGGHPEYCSNAPLRGSKWNLYEGGIRVPLIIRWPDRVEPASICDTPVIGYDLFPTFTEVAGGSKDTLDGQSIVELLDGMDSTETRNLIWHFPYYHPETTFSSAIDRIGISDFATSKTRPQSAIRQGPYKLIQFAEDDRIELYHLTDDIGEQTDLTLQRPVIAERLSTKLNRTLVQMNARRAVAKRVSKSLPAERPDD